MPANSVSPPLDTARTSEASQLENEVMNASPAQLIVLLLDGAIAAVNKARIHLEQGNIAERGMAISKAIEIVESGLKSAINREEGGEVAQSLLAAYDLILHHRLMANLKNDLDKLSLAHSMLSELSETWRQVCESTECGAA